MSVKERVESLIREFEDSICKYIIANAQKMRFDHTHYTIQPDADGKGYDIFLSLTGHGKQHFQVLIVGDEFTIRGKNLEGKPDGHFPTEILTNLTVGTVAAWISQPQGVIREMVMDELNPSSGASEAPPS